MGDIVDMDTRRPHRTGQAKCIACGKVWTAVAPDGTYHLQCPDCKEVKGRWMMETDQAEEEDFICSLMKENRALKQLVADLTLVLHEKTAEHKTAHSDLLTIHKLVMCPSEAAPEKDEDSLTVKKVKALCLRAKDL